MADFNVRSDSVNVEQIMEQIRARIREKRGVDYTEEQLRELAAVKLEKFLDPRGVRSDLLEQFKRRQPTYEPPLLPTLKFEDTTLYETHRGLLQSIRRLLNPILKLFFNPNALSHALHTQAEINRANIEREVSRENQRRDLDALYYEVIHNLVFEMTRLGIETKNLKMRVESLTSRLEFNERRARALESAQRPPAPSAASGQSVSTAAGPATPTGSGQISGGPEGPGQRSRRRRRRRGRRGGGASAVAMMTAGAGQAPVSQAGPPRLEPPSADQPLADQPPLSLTQALAGETPPIERRPEAASTTSTEPS
ncbi:MAG: hypothetical protein DMF85_18660, partial [Acidobacteria bacterium]